jgi:hypothetical protein
MLGHPTVHVALRELTAEGVLKGLKNGRVVITENPGSPRLDLVVLAGGRKAHVGDTIKTDETTTTAKLLARVLGAKNNTLRVITNSGVKHLARISWDNETVALRLKLPETDTYIRVDVAGGEGDLGDTTAKNLELKALANPVYITRRKRPPGQTP